MSSCSLFIHRLTSFWQKMHKICNFLLSPATSGRHNSAVIIDRSKFITKWSPYKMSSFHFHRWNQFKLIPWHWHVHSAQDIDSESLLHQMRHHSMLQWDNDGHVLMTSLAEGKDRSFNKITANWVMTQFAVILLNDLSFPSRALATAQITALWDIGTLAMQRWYYQPCHQSWTIPVLFLLMLRTCTAYWYLFHVASTDVEMCKSFNFWKTLYDSSTVTLIRALPAEYCIVGIPHSTAI